MSGICQCHGIVSDCLYTGTQGLNINLNTHVCVGVLCKAGGHGGLLRGMSCSKSSSSPVVIVRLHQRWGVTEDSQAHPNAGVRAGYTQKRMNEEEAETITTD